MVNNKSAGETPAGIITVNTNVINKMAQEGGKFVFKREAETEILKIKKLIALLDKTMESIKEAITVAGQTLDPNFKGVVGEYVRATYRRFGEKYTYDKNREAELKDFLKTVTWVKPDSTKIDAYAKENGKLPEGIIEKDREPKLSIEVIDKNLLEDKI